MNIYESAQDYLERILILNQTLEHVRSIDIAHDMNVTKQSVHRAIKNLRDNHYIAVDKQGYITLTEKGQEIAQKMYERHTLLTKFFISIGVSHETALKDACKIEHDLSAETFDALQRILHKNES